MIGPKTLFEINPALDRGLLKKCFARDTRIQVRDVLTHDAAITVRAVLERDTPWGIAWCAPGGAPVSKRADAWRATPPPERHAVLNKVAGAARRGEFAFLYAQYPMLDAYLQKWRPGGPHDLLLEHLNAPPMLDFVREVTGIGELRKADAQATLYGPGHFLTQHDDSHAAEGRRIAYVLSLTSDWRPDWGGYLLFHDEEGEVVASYKPRFNALNLFAVPQRHSVSYVPPFAPVGRFAITGWFRDQ